MDRLGAARKEASRSQIRAAKVEEMRRLPSAFRQAIERWPWRTVRSSAPGTWGSERVCRRPFQARGEAGCTGCSGIRLAWQRRARAGELGLWAASDRLWKLVAIW